MVVFEKCKRQFTLLELLIVIAVIGILITLLVPSLRSARLSAMTGVSMSNLKQIHTGSMAYASNHNGFLFLAERNPTISHSGANWRVPVYEYISGEPIPASGGVAYMRNSTYRDIMYCPVLVLDRDGYPSAHGKGRGHYGLNKFFGQFPNEAHNDYSERGYKSIHFAALTADKEPIYMPTKAMNSTSSGYFLSGGELLATDRGTPEYLYTNTKSITNFLDGNISLKSPSWGSSVNSLLNNHKDFK